MGVTMRHHPSPVPDRHDGSTGTVELTPAPGDEGGTAAENELAVQVQVMSSARRERRETTSLRQSGVARRRQVSSQEVSLPKRSRRHRMGLDAVRWEVSTHYRRSSLHSSPVDRPGRAIDCPAHLS